MAFLHHIPNNIPGLNHLATVNEKVLKPGLSVAQTAKEYVGTMRKDKHQDQNQTHNIVIETLSRQDTSKSDRSDPIDHEFTDEGRAQRQRVQELLNTRAFSPPFPKDLPKRPQRKKQPINRWKIGFLGLLLASAAAIVPLSIVAARKSTPDCDPNQPGRQSQATVTATTTYISLLAPTGTQVVTAVSTTTDVKIETTVITEAAKLTGLGDPLKDSAELSRRVPLR